jgi:hypothetical protein
MQKHFHQSNHAGVVNLDAGHFGRAVADRLGDPLEQGKVNVNVQALRLKTGKAVRDFQEPLANGGQIAESLLEAEVGQIVAADLVAQKGCELLVLFEKRLLQ